MEEKLGRKLKQSEVVHHINGDPEDNRIENLHLCKDGQEHSFIHNGIDFDEWLKECRDTTFRNANLYLRPRQKGFHL